MNVSGRRCSPSGQTLVEFALVIPVFLLILFGLIDMGRYVFLQSALSQAAREAARTAVVEASWIGSTDPACNTSGGPTCPASVSALRNDMLVSSNKMMTPFGSIVLARLFTSCDSAAPPAPVSTTTCNSRSVGSLVSVRVTEDFQPLTPIVAQIVGTIPASGAAVMVIN